MKFCWEMGFGIGVLLVFKGGEVIVYLECIFDGKFSLRILW